MKNLAPRSFTSNSSTVQLFRVLSSFVIIVFFGVRLAAQNVSLAGAVSGNGSYPDLASVFAVINASTQTSASITVNITSSTTETTTAALNAGAWTSLNISPSGGTRTITGNIAGPLLDLYGADNIKIDGINSSGNSLTVSNTNTTSSSASTIRFMVDATSNTITNVTILGSSPSNLNGVVNFSVALSSGNSNNTITNCNIGPAGGNFPTNAIYSVGNSGVNHSGNVIQNNNIYDYFNPMLSSDGILLSGLNTGWNITGNRFYQTSAKTVSGSSSGISHNCIQIVSGNSHSVTANVFGYASPSSTGTYIINGSNGGVSTFFNAIDLAVGTSTATSVQGNTISSIQIPGIVGSVNFLLCGLNVTTGNINVGNISPNVFGGTTGTNLLNANSVAGIFAYYSGSTGSINIQNNRFGGMTANAGANTGGFLAGIYIDAPGATVAGNMVGSPTPSNIICGHSVTAIANTQAMGIYVTTSTGSGTIAVTNNTIQNISSYGYGTRSLVRGIYAGSTSASVFNANLINNLSLVAGDRDDYGSGFLPGALGISMPQGSGNSASNNTISAISITGTANIGCYAGGIFCQSSTDGTISANVISDITNSQGATSFSVPSVASGILLGFGSGTRIVNNNFINLGLGNTDNTIYTGIQDNNFLHGESNRQDLFQHDKY